MRTTLTLNDHVAQAVRETARRASQPIKTLESMRELLGMVEGDDAVESR